jgi:hypothetical protein
MIRLGIGFTLFFAASLAVAAWFCVPRGYQAASELAAQDDPARLADLALKSFDGNAARREIEAALAAQDADLARSFVELAAERGIVIDPALNEQVEAAVRASTSTRHTVQSFVSGFVFGEPDDMAGIAGTALGDLLVFGDVRDAVREGSRMARGEEANKLVLGLSIGGLAITAGTLASAGIGTPARIGASLIKAAGKSGRIGARLARALAVEGAENIVKLTGDLGRIQAKAGTKAALDGVRLAETPAEVGRVASLAVAKGGKTRAILKLLGRGAIVLTASLFDLAWWIFWAGVTLLGFCASLKRWVERMTLSVIRAGKARRRRRLERCALAALAARPA